MREIDCLPSTSKAKLRFDRISFEEIPGQSRLFTDYQNDPLKLTRYYPSAVAAHTEVSDRVDEVLERYSTDRKALCDVLMAQNQKFGAGEGTFENIKLLRSGRTVAVVTGQQAGLFTGPLYTVYKALSAVRMVECLRNRGIDAVPVFWAATEDHDFEEIASAFILGKDGEEVDVTIASSESSAGWPVGNVVIPETFSQQLDDRLRGFWSEGVGTGIRDQLAECWRPGRTIGEAFCADIQQLFAEWGLIVVNPLDDRIKKLAAPIYAYAVERSGEIVRALLERSNELATDGYHSQVLIEPDYFPLFFQDDDGVRRSIRQSGGHYHVTGTKLSFNFPDLYKMVVEKPERFSPGVMLRSVVQDHLFPTICYFGGGAEVSYFAQNSEVYRILDRPATTILHRQSFTIIDSKRRRILEKYGLSVRDLFQGFDGLLPRIVDRFVNPSTARLFADVEESINVELHRLDQELSRIDPTLAANLATRRRKILYHIAALQKKFRRVQVERDEIVFRQLNSLFSTLLPKGQLQERRLNVRSFLARYGHSFIRTVYESIDLDERGHRVLHLS